MTNLTMRLNASTSIAILVKVMGKSLFDHRTYTTAYSSLNRVFILTVFETVSYLSKVTNFAYPHVFTISRPHSESPMEFRQDLRQKNYTVALSV